MKRCVVHALQRMLSILWMVLLIASVIIDGVAITMFVVLPAEAESVDRVVPGIIVTIDGSGESQTETEDDDDANTDETYPAVEFPQKPHPTVTEDETVAETVVADEAAKPEVTETAETSETAETVEVATVYPTYPTLEEITPGSSTEARIRALMGYFINEGFTPESAAGIAGNIACESGYDPSAVNTGGGYYGLCQWNTSSVGGYWWYSISEYLSTNGYLWNSFAGQIKAILYCENRGMLSDRLLEELKDIKNIDRAVELFTVYYEGAVGGSSITRWYRPGNYYQGLEDRTAEAYEAFRVFMDPEATYSGNKPYYII